MRQLHSMSALPGGGESAVESLALRAELPVATPWTGSLEQVQGNAGPAWRDREFQSELRERAERLGMGTASRASLESLMNGEADCVITGQQPGLLGGPMLLAAKLASAVGLARRLTELGPRPVVAVYWCGADDSDFEETTRAWIWSAEGPLRVRLERENGADGLRVGSLPAAAIAELERNALAHAGIATSWDWRSDLQKLLPARDFGERAAIWAELGFGAQGLVVVDARSARLNQLGQPLFERYRTAHREWTVQLLQHTQRLRERGLPTPLHEDALASGLFRLEGERRTKLRPDELAAAPSDRLQVSVLLRPLWQDALLAPRAAILGPTELAYHAQLAPLYAALQVRAAIALPRATLMALPASVWAADPQLLEDGQLWADPQLWLQRHALDAAQREALERYEGELQQAHTRLRASLPELDASVLDGHGERQGLQIARLREALLPLALAKRGADWQHLAAWCGVGGQAQERVYALAALWQRFGAAATQDMLRELGEAYAQALARAESPRFLATLAGSG